MARFVQRRLPAARRAIFTRGFVAKASMLAALTVASALAFHSGSLPLALMQVGDTWIGETLVAVEEFAIDKTADSLAADRARARRRTEPVFVKTPDAAERIVANLDTLQAQMDAIMLAYRGYRMNIQRARLASDSVADVDYWALADADSSRYMEKRQRARVFLSDEQWRILGNDFVSRDPDMPDRSRIVVPGPAIYQHALDRLWTYATAFARTEVLDIPTDSIYTDHLKVRNTDASTFERITKSSVFDQRHIYQNVEADLAPYFADNLPANVAAALVNAVFVASLYFDVGATDRARDQAELQISPTRGMIAEDEIVVRTGEVITPEIKQRLESLERKRAEGTGPKFHEPRSLGKVILAFCTFGIFFAYVFVARRQIFTINRKMLLIALLYAATIVLFAVAVRRDVTFMFAVPTLLVSVVLTVVFDARIALVGTICLALVGGLISGAEYAFEFAFATIVAGTLAVFAVSGARNRAKFFVSAGSALGGYVLVFTGYWLLEAEGRQFINHVMMAGINCFLLITAYPLLWVFERTFNLSSELRLIELSDYNQPLLRQLQQDAAGTFSHSLQVASLAEAAAEAISAEALLTRVGALYHDVGKLVSPEFFVENQRSGINPHSKLSAQESTNIIKSHVSYGQTLAEEHGLPGNIVDFIPMHHGTTRIEYFYHKARKADGEVDEAEYRYPGPRPQTKETGILMLCDGVEAACKSITEPSLEKLEERIDAVFEARINDGQLDDSLLTFKDLKMIKQTFIKQLSAVYHVRVKYPGQS